MREGVRNCMHLIMMPIWRRKYILVSGCILWAIFYLYLHYVTVPEDMAYSGEGISVKHPVDMTLVNRESSGKLTTKNKIFRETKEPRAISSMSMTIEKPHIKNEHHHNHGGITPQINEAAFSKDVTRSSSQKYKKHKSVREKFEDNGIHPTSILIQSKEKQTDDNFNLSTSESPPPSSYVPPMRLVHFDLKGAPPKISYFKSIFPVIRAAGANGILMEYEDTFPFWGALSPTAAQNAYKKREIRYIQELAQKYELKVIPLVQTFGHLEFVLKLQEFKHLREVEDIPQALCPTNNGSLMMVKMMIDQVMSLHPDSQWLHIGSDEVYQLGNCHRCSRYDRNSLFLAYVRKVARYVREQHKVIPIMWDDMLRHISVQEMEKYEMGQLVEPMAWTYVEDVYLFIPDSLWEKYSQVFPYMWSASAYKGAFGETLTVPDAKRHLENNKAWLNVMSEQNRSFKGFRGIALTGWQRYDHFSSLCELLPSALPSLVLNLLTVSQGSFDSEIFGKMQKLLECSSRMHYHLDLDHDPYMWRALGVCFFPGSAVFRLTLRHSDVAKSLDKYIFDITTHKGWMTEYNVNHNFSSPMRINELLRDFSYYNSSLQMLQEAAVKALREIYDDSTVSEWIELNILPYAKKMKAIWFNGMRLKKFHVWPRRPFTNAINLPPQSTDFGFIKS